LGPCRLLCVKNSEGKGQEDWKDIGGTKKKLGGAEIGEGGKNPQRERGLFLGKTSGGDGRVNSGG